MSSIRDDIKKSTGKASATGQSVANQPAQATQPAAVAQPEQLPAPPTKGVSVPATAPKPTNVPAPDATKPTSPAVEPVTPEQGGQPDFAHRGERNLLDVIKEYGQPYDYAAEMAREGRRRKAGLFTDTISLAVNALSGIAGANRLGEIPNTAGKYTDRLDKLHALKTKGLLDNRNVLLDAAVKQYGYDRMDRLARKRSKQAQKQFEIREARMRDEADRKQKYQAGKDSADQSLKLERLALDKEKAKADEAYKKGRLSTEKYKAETARIEKQRRTTGKADKDKDVELVFVANPDDPDAETSKDTGKKVKRTHMPQADVDNVVRMAMADKEFFTRHPSLVLEKDEYSGKLKPADPEDIAATYLEEIEAKKSYAPASVPKSDGKDYGRLNLSLPPYDVPVEGAKKNGKRKTSYTLGGVTVTNATFDALDSISNTKGIDKGQKMKMMLQEMKSGGFTEEQAVNVLSQLEID